MNINMGFSCTFRNTRFAWVWWYLTLVRGLHKCEILELNMRFLRSNISYFHPVSTKKSISEFKCPLLTFSLSPLNYPRSVPSWQCPSPWLLPANLPPSPPLPSPPPCWQLHVLISHLAHSWDQPLSKAGDSCHADSPPDISCLNGQVGLLLCLPPRICQLLLLAPCLGHRWHQFVYCVRSFTKTSKGDTEQRNGVEKILVLSILLI